MDIETLRPNGTVQHNWPSLSGSSADAAVSDDSDATYIRNNTATSQTDIFTLDDTVLTTETINSIDIRSRARSESSANGRFRVGLELSGNTELAPYHNSVPTSETNFLDTNIPRPGGGMWTVADLNSLQAVAEGDEVTSDGIRLFEIWVDVHYTAGGATTRRNTLPLLGVG